jgi:hypothetical protein
MSELELRDTVCVMVELILDDIVVDTVIDTLDVIDGVVDTTVL